MKLCGMNVTIESIDAAYITDAFLCIKQIIDNTDSDISEGWNIDFLKEKMSYEEGEFEFIINDILDLANHTMEENVTFVEKLLLNSSAVADLESLIHYFKKAVAIINPNDLDLFFYEHMRSKICLHQAFVSSSIEIIQILDAITNIIEIIDDESETITDN